jgi:hypothetical protein
VYFILIIVSWPYPLIRDIFHSLIIASDRKKSPPMFNHPLYYILDEHDNPVPTNDSHTANELLINADKRRVGLTEKDIAGHSIMVSTVFLVIDHNYTDGPPILYETMLFIDSTEVGSATQRYETKEQAQKGHEETSSKVEQILMQLGERNIESVDIAGLLEASND